MPLLLMLWYNVVKRNWTIILMQTVLVQTVLNMSGNDQHSSSVSHNVSALKLPMAVDITGLQNDLQQVLKLNWPLHYNSSAYSGNWSSIALFSSDGKYDNIYAMPDEENSLRDTCALQRCPAIQKLMAQLNFKVISARLLNLAAGAVIKPHRDHCLGYEDGVFRIHFPIQTNPEVEFILNNERIMMLAGECWYINANYMHSVANNGTSDRVHLVIDGNRNAWTDAWFFKLADKERLITKQNRVLAAHEHELMLKELERMNTETSRKIIQEVKSGN